MMHGHKQSGSGKIAGIPHLSGYFPDSRLLGRAFNAKEII